MATCRIQRTNQGYQVQAPNGAESFLYAELLDKTRDAELAKDLYVLAETPQFIQNVTLPSVQSEATKTVVEYNGTKVHLKQHTNPITNRPTGLLELDLISTPEEKRGQGNAKIALQQALDYADSVQRDVILTVAPRDKSTTETKLKKFYSDFGFREFEFDFQMLRKRKTTTNKKSNPFFDENGEIKAQYVLQYAQNQNVSKEKLNFQEQVEIQSMMAVKGVENSEQLYETLKQAFYSEGMFSPTEQSLTESGLYSSFEARNIIADPSLLIEVQDAIERLKNTPRIENEVLGAPEDFIKKSTSVGILGNLTTNNPYQAQKELLEEYAGEEEIDNPELTESQKEEFAQYMRLPKLNKDLTPTTTTIIKPNATRVVDDVTLIEDVEFLQGLSPEVQQTEEALNFVETLEKKFAKYGIDIVGLNTYPEYVQLLQALKEVAVNPSSENIQGFEQAYSEVFSQEILQKEELLKGLDKDATLVYSETELSEQQLYEEQSLIKTDTAGVLRKVQKLSNEELRVLLQGQIETPVEEFIQRNITSGLSEDVLMQKTLFGYSLEAPQIKKTVNFQQKANSFSGDAQYLQTEFLPNFWATVLQEKQKQSQKYAEFYFNFDIDEQGLQLINNDPITVQKIKSYLRENEVKDSLDIQQYSLLSQTMPNLSVAKVVGNVEISTKDQRRALILNGQVEAPKPNKPFSQLSPTVLSIQEGTQEFVETPQGIFEIQETQNGVSYYGKLQPNESREYFDFTPEAPAYIEVSDYASKTVDTTKAHKKIKKLYSAKESEKIMQENFDCI